MNMDLNIILWIGGTIFSLGIFAVKVGLGLGFGRAGWKVVFLTLCAYLILFVLIAVLSNNLVKALEPLLRKGLYLHALMATGLIAWGGYALKKTCSHRHQAFLLLLPCPVCITAMIYSTWAALSVIDLPPVLVGLTLGSTFVILSVLFLFMARVNRSKDTGESLGFSMMGVGLYFLGALVIPAKIEEARTVYESFVSHKNNISLEDGSGVSLILIITLMVGFFTGKGRGIPHRSGR